MNIGICLYARKDYIEPVVLFVHLSIKKEEICEKRLLNRNL